MSLHVFGIRHHGPGSARSLRAALEALRPDMILVEGPPEGDAVLPLVPHPAMEPPVALLVYAPEKPRLGVYYPFAVFSPEWQAIHYGLTAGIPVRFMDLPQAIRLALLAEQEEPALVEAVAGADHTGHDPEAVRQFRADPLRWLAEAAGYNDGERWWEHMVEQRRGNDAEMFAAILEAMTALREAAPPIADPIEELREAYMRKTIRAAAKAGPERIAVVCGAWHAPALAGIPPARADNDLLKGLPKIKVTATWVPWTYGRLTFGSGYGAGIESPGWYDHLWQTQDEVAVSWMARVARLLRAEDLGASTAQIIDAVRLAESLAALRERPIPGLPELNEAAQAVLCFGREAPMRLVWEKLIVGERLGEVPDETPMVPLQQDLQRLQKRLRLKPEAEPRDLELDLRQETDLARSHLLHRLNILDIEWGRPRPTTGKGTFKEGWRLQWKPELAVDLIEASTWGSTIYEAAAAYARDAADSAATLPELTILVDDVLKAALPDVTGHLMHRLQEKAALTSDIAHLMDALPPLARILRYSDVRRTDAQMVAHVVDGLVARISIGLPGACASLDDDAAAAMFARLMACNGALMLLQNAAHSEIWRGALRQLADRRGLHGLIAGRSCRLLHDAGVFDAAESARRLRLALSRATEPPQAAAWIDGFLRESGLILLHDDGLWNVIDHWLTSLPGETFAALLPLVRRTFSTFSAPERRQMGERAKRRTAMQAEHEAEAGRFDAGRAAAVLPLVAQLLGIEAFEDQG